MFKREMAMPIEYILHKNNSKIQSHINLKIKFDSYKFVF